MLAGLYFFDLCISMRVFKQGHNSHFRTVCHHLVLKDKIISCCSHYFQEQGLATCLLNEGLQNFLNYPVVWIACTKSCMPAVAPYLLYSHQIGRYLQDRSAYLQQIDESISN